MTITSLLPTSTEAMRPSGEVLDDVWPGMLRVYVFRAGGGGFLRRSDLSFSMLGESSNSEWSSGGASWSNSALVWSVILMEGLVVRSFGCSSL